MIMYLYMCDSQTANIERITKVKELNAGLVYCQVCVRVLMAYSYKQ